MPIPIVGKLNRTKNDNGIGYTMNVAAKITSLTNPNRVSVGENLCKLLHPGLQEEFHELTYGADEWDYINRDTGNIYKVYTQN